MNKSGREKVFEVVDENESLFTFYKLESIENTGEGLYFILNGNKYYVCENRLAQNFKPSCKSMDF